MLLSGRMRPARSLCSPARRRTPRRAARTPRAGARACVALSAGKNFAAACASLFAPCAQRAPPPHHHHPLPLLPRAQRTEEQLTRHTTGTRELGLSGSCENLRVRSRPSARLLSRSAAAAPYASAALGERCRETDTDAPEEAEGPPPPLSSEVRSYDPPKEALLAAGLSSSARGAPGAASGAGRPPPRLPGDVAATCAASIALSGAAPRAARASADARRGASFFVQCLRNGVRHTACTPATARLACARGGSPHQRPPKASRGARACSTPPPGARRHGHVGVALGHVAHPQAAANRRQPSCSSRQSDSGRGYLAASPSMAHFRVL